MTRFAWDYPEHNFFTVAEDALAGSCHRHKVRPPISWTWRHKVHGTRKATLHPSFTQLPNWTEQFLSYDPGPWQLISSNAVVSLTHLALTLRIFCTAFVTRCVEALGAWRAAWCVLLRRLQAAARMLPRAGRIVSALNTSAAEVIRQALPRALLEPLAGLAKGKASLELAVQDLTNITITFAEYVEHALILGEEMMMFGRSRVSMAFFHGDVGGSSSVATGSKSNHADVLLWLLRSASSHQEGAAPYIVELGVESAACGARLLAEHSTLQWFGVDKYDDSTDSPWHDPDHPGARDLTALLQARSRLRPWLGERAHLLMGHTVSSASLWKEQKVDMVFVDADHSEAAVLADIAAWTPHVRSGGIMAGHDYCRTFSGVVRAAHAALPRGAILHLAPDLVFWWHVPEQSE